MAARSGTDVPGGVSVVAILAIIVGAFELVGGVIILIFNGDVHGYSSGAAVVFGIVTLLVGLIYIWVGRGLQRLNPSALFVGLFVSALRLVYDVVWLIAYGLDGIGITGLIALVFNALVFGALWSGRRAFEARTGGAQPA
jgi:hypothetical protein